MGDNRYTFDSTKELRFSINTKADEVKMKFEFYYIALTFTILGLSIQTTKIGLFHSGNIFIYICMFCEYMSWISLLISGYCGLIKLSNTGELLSNKDMVLLGFDFDGSFNSKLKKLFNSHIKYNIWQRRLFFTGLHYLL